MSGREEWVCGSPDLACVSRASRTGWRSVERDVLRARIWEGDLNLVNVTGSLTGDPEPRTDRLGQRICRLRVTLPPGPPPREVPVDVKSVGPAAGVCAARLTTGHPVCVSGTLVFVEWVGSDDAKRSRLSVKTWQVQFLSTTRPEGTADEEREWRKVSAGAPRYAPAESETTETDSASELACLIATGAQRAAVEGRGVGR